MIKYIISENGLHLGITSELDSALGLHRPCNVKLKVKLRTPAATGNSGTRIMNTNNVESKKRVTITATDRIGRTESITMILSAKTADRLEKASQEPDDLGEMNDYRLSCALNNIYDSYEEWQDYPSSVKVRYKTEISKAQFYRLRDFYDLVYHKFYKYTLSITIK